MHGGIPDSHPYRVTSTKCRINTVDDGHRFGRNIYRKQINIIRKIVYQVGFIYKIKYSVSHSLPNPAFL